MTTTRLRPAAAAAAVLVLASGCQSATESLVENVSGAEDVEFEDDGSFSVTTEDGSVAFEADGDGGGEVTFEGEDGSEGSMVTGAGSLPEGFPERIPLVEGEIESGTVIESDGTRLWQVILTVPGLTVEQIGAACDDVVDAGFTELGRNDLGGVVICTFEDGDLGVGLQGVTDGTDTVSYSVNDNLGGDGS